MWREGGWNREKENRYTEKEGEEVERRREGWEVCGRERGNGGTGEGG